MHEDAVRQILNTEFKKFGFTVHNYPNAIGLWPNEQASLLWLALNSNPETDWMEIGSFCGGSAVLLCLARKFLKAGPAVHSVDRMFENIFDQNIAKGGLAGISRKIETESLYLQDHYDGRSLGFCFIDGWHSFKGALLDFIVVKDWLAPGAIVAFHDVGQQPYPPTFPDEDYKIALERYDEFMAEALPNPRTQEQTYNLDYVVAYIVKTYGFEPVDVPILDGTTNCLTAIRKPL